MSLQEMYEAYEPPRKCKVCDWRETVPDDVREFFDTQGPINGAKMTRFCREKFGLKADPSTVRAHFRHVS